MAKSPTLLTALAAGFALTFAVPASAQDGAKKDAGNDAKKDVKKDAKKDGKKTEKKKKPPQDRVIKVVLKNGNIVRGYALDGRLYEREVQVTASRAGSRTGFKRQEAYEPCANKKVKGAGVRIWYPNNAQGFLFIQYTQIKRVDAGRKLTRREQEKLFAAIRLKEKKIAEAAAKLREQNKVRQAAADAIRRAQIEESIAKSKGTTVAADRKAREALLTEFPPSPGLKGWNEQRKNEIDRKYQVLGILPSGKEMKFATKYAEWVKARDEAKQIGWTPPKKAGAKSGDAGKTSKSGSASK